MTAGETPGPGGPPPVQGPFHARVRYTEPMVRRAVRTFVWRSLLRRAWLWAATAALMVAAVVLGIWSGQLIAVLSGSAGLLAVPLFWAAVWNAHFRNTVGRFRSLEPPESDVTLDGDGITLASSRGRVTVPWSGFVDVWTLPDCWMLFLAPNQFVTLPTADLPPAMAAALRAHLPPPSRLP